VTNGATGTKGRTPTGTILALDGSVVGTIDGTFALDRPINLAGLVVDFRPDLFVVVNGSLLKAGGCIRREVVDAEDSASGRTADSDDE
jgi:hypothetical protein